MTYSIVARDRETGELGVAVQSHWFAVGPIVPWARPGVGAVATQANVAVHYGPRGLALMGSGMDAAAALARLLAQDSAEESRQVAMVDAFGGVAAHTGADCMMFAGDCQAEAVSCQANIMARPSVWPAMLEAYRGASGTLTARLLAALDAAEAEGGDLRGRQSAAILVVPGAGEPWETVVSLRVEDHPDPLRELGRLVGLRGAYAVAGEGDTAAGEGDFDRAAALYRRAAQLARAGGTESDELQFWAGLGAAHVGDWPAALADVRAAIAVHDGWLELLRRLPPELAPAAVELRARLGGG